MEAITIGGGARKALVEQLRSLESEKIILESRLHKWIIKYQSDTITIDGIERYLHSNTKMLTGCNPDASKMVIENFLESVVISKNHINVTFKITVVMSGGGGGS